MGDDYWIHAILGIMVLLNFFLNLTSVYLGRYKKYLLEDQLQHILEHVCPAYEEEDNPKISELEVKLSKDKANFESWDNPSGEEKS
jgi:hypothetical protein